MKVITQETREAILQDYNNPANTVRGLEQKYGIERRDITRIAVEMGATPRRPARYGVKMSERATAPKKICARCKKTIAVDGARFCPFCGADIRSSKEICADQIERIIPRVSLLPESVRNEVLQVLINAKNELTKK